MASEQFSLCWDNFHKNMSSGMNSLLENEDLVDVTLAVEGKCLKAHKMVLSVCSPYFKELFKSNPCQHPIVFMKDVSYVALSDLLQFMYQGEVQVSQENLTTFIKTAEALQIKGLTGDGNGSADTDTVEPTAHEKPVHQIEEYKPAPRSKKQQPAPITAQSPTVKRPRLSVSSSESQPLPPTVAKSEPVTSTPSGGVSEPPVQFKMEPYDQSQSLIDETGDENFGDDTLDDANVDDTEDYSMMEGGVGEEEPQAGTSTDGAGEGQAEMNLEILRQLYFLRSVHTELLVEVKTLKNNYTRDETLNDSLSVLSKLKLPCETEEELLELQEFLMTTENFHKTVNEICIWGGRSLLDFVNRCLRGLITNHLAVNYSWLGRRTKKGFCDLNIARVVVEASLKAKKCNEKKAAEQEIARWLRRAADRLKSFTKEKNHRQNVGEHCNPY